MEIKFEWYGVKQIHAALSRFGDKVSNLRPAFNDIADDFYKVEKVLFDTQGSRGSRGKWKNLNEKYAKWKSKNYPGRPILVLKGDLRDSLISRGGENIRIITDRQCILGTGDPKGKWHYLGSGKLPIRRPIDLNAGDKMRWVKIIHRFIIKLIPSSLRGKFKE